jgi:hypothetical protein
LAPKGENNAMMEMNRNPENPAKQRIVAGHHDVADLLW